MDRARYQRLQSIFDAAVELDPEERGALLDRECAGDPELRRAVEQLLCEDATGHELGDGPALLARALYADTPLTDSRPPPARLGRYRIVERIGEGGMGVVYLGEQDRPRRPVALKVMRPGAFSDELLVRFRREAELLGRLQHAGIARIYEAGEVETGFGVQPFYAMEYVDGVELRAYADRNGLNLRERLALLGRVCDAVHHAHEKGIVHRDLKPGNVLVVRATSSGESDESEFALLGQPKVLDFGVSCLASEARADGTQLTLPGRVLGTLDYMSPEQAAGEPGIDARADVYSLGVLGFELLTGRLPRSLADVPIPRAVRVLEDAPPRLDSVDPRFRGDVSVVIEKALAPERERRYPTAGALADDIRRHLHEQPITARAPTFGYRLSRFVRRNKPAVVGAIVAGLSLSVGLWVVVDSERDGTRRRAVAAQGERRVRLAAYANGVQAAFESAAIGDTRSACLALEETDPELRGWEWDLAASSLDRDLAYIPMGIAKSPTVRVSAGVSKLLLATDDATLTVFDVATRSYRHHPYPGQTAEQYGAAALLDDGDAALWGGPDGRLLRLDLAGGEPPRLLWSTSGAIHAIAVSPDGRRAAIASDASSVRSTLTVVDLELGAVVAGDPDAPFVRWLDFSPDAALLAASEHYGSVEIRDAATLRPLRSLTGGTSSDVCFSPSGRRLAAVGPDHRILVWGVESGALEAALGPVPRVADWG